MCSVMKSVIKITILLSLITNSLSKLSKNEDFLKQAAEQLNRLSTFKKTEININQQSEINVNKHIINDIKNEKILLEKNIYINPEIMKRIDELANTAYKIYHDPNNTPLLMQERIKRSGSGDFISGIAGKVINGVVGASSGLSGGSSGPQAHDSYGVPVQPYGGSSFSIWDFKKAILNTLIQALKAIAGGAIAFKGHLIKGGGFIVQTGGRLISSAGEAASTLGTSIASSAIISAPKPVHNPQGYSYDHPPVQHDYSYDGPPPNSGPGNDAYSQGHYNSATDEKPDKEPGLLVIKPLKTEEIQSDQNIEPRRPDKHHQTTQIEIQPSLSSTIDDNSFNHSPSKDNKSIAKLVGLVSGASGPIHPDLINQIQVNQGNYLPVDQKDQPTSVGVDNFVQQEYNYPPLGTYEQYEQSKGSNHNQNYQSAQQEIQSLINPHLNLPTKEPTKFNVNYHNNFIEIPIIDNQKQLDPIAFQSLTSLPNNFNLFMNHDFNYGNLRRSSLNLQKRWKKALIFKPISYRFRNYKLH